MTIRPILQFPDPRLREVALPVTAFDAELRTLAEDLLDTMRDASGLGITASHIGVAKRLAVIELEDGTGVRTYINPRVVWASDDMLIALPV